VGACEYIEGHPARQNPASYVSGMSSTRDWLCQATVTITTLKCRWVAVAALAFVLFPAFALSQQNHEAKMPHGLRADQGCVNQGNDRREFAPVVCWLQRHLSWRSEHKPYFTSLGKPEGTHVGLAWPPYLVFNSPEKDGHWRIFRFGFRYDRTWRGYIFPTMAAKRLSQPLSY